LYSVNWQREIRITKLKDKVVVIKKDRKTKEMNEYLLVFMYSFMSILLLHPSTPPRIGKSIIINEGKENRKRLKKFGISTPSLYFINNNTIVEEYIEEGNLYKYLRKTKDTDIVFTVGVITGRLHNAGLCFIDNKAQNYLVKNSSIFRTDLGLIQKATSTFAKSLDIGLFLGSLIDLEQEKYNKIEEMFLLGYQSESKGKIPKLSIIIRNIASLGLSSNHHNLIINLLRKTNIKYG
jgi:Kae1-associated kinase Bud32